jgi:hypothetical protein
VSIEQVFILCSTNWQIFFHFFCPHKTFAWELSLSGCRSGHGAGRALESSPTHDSSRGIEGEGSLFPPLGHQLRPPKRSSEQGRLPMPEGQKNNSGCSPKTNSRDPRPLNRKKNNKAGLYLLKTVIVNISFFSFSRALQKIYYCGFSVRSWTWI